MFNIKYNFLAILQLLINVGVSVFLIRTFGTSNQADAYLLGYSIFTAMQLIQVMFVEQFMYFYNDIKEKNRNDAYNFYGFSILFSVVLGVTFSIILYLGVDVIFNLFAGHLEVERKVILLKILRIFVVGNAFYLLNFINLRLLNAEMKFSVPYLIEMFPNFCALIVLLIMSILHTKEILFVPLAIIIGFAISSISGVLYAKKIGIPIRMVFFHKQAVSFIKNSFFMRLGHNIHNFLFVPITNNVLSMLPAGNISVFYYAQRLTNVVKTAIMGPVFKVFLSKTSQYWAQDNLPRVMVMIKDYLSKSIPIFIISSVVVYFFIPIALNVVAPMSISVEDLYLIKKLFGALSVWSFIVITEFAFVAVGIVSKNSKIFIKTNTVFIVIYAIIAFFLVDKLGVFSIAVGTIIAQIINFYLYGRYAFKLLNKGHVLSDFLKGLYPIRKEKI